MITGGESFSGTASFSNGANFVAPPVGFESESLCLFGNKIAIGVETGNHVQFLDSTPQCAVVPTTGNDLTNKTYVDSIIPVAAASSAVWLMGLGQGSITLTISPQELYIDDTAGPHNGTYTSLNSQINGAVSSGLAYSTGPDYNSGTIHFNHSTRPGAYDIDKVPNPQGSWQIEYKVNFNGGNLVNPKLFWTYGNNPAANIIAGSGAAPYPVSAGVQIEISGSFIVQLTGVGQELYFWAYDGTGETPGNISG